MLLLLVVVMLGETETAIRIDGGVFMLLPTTGTETMTTTLAVVATGIDPTEVTDIVLAEAVASAARAKVAVAVLVAVQAAVAVAAEAAIGITDAHTDTIVVRENIDDAEEVRAVHAHAHVPLHVRAVGALRLIEIWTSLLLRRLDMIMMIGSRTQAAE